MTGLVGAQTLKNKSPPSLGSVMVNMIYWWCCSPFLLARSKYNSIQIDLLKYFRSSVLLSWGDRIWWNVVHNIIILLCAMGIILHHSCVLCTSSLILNGYNSDQLISNFDFQILMCKTEQYQNQGVSIDSLIHSFTWESIKNFHLSRWKNIHCPNSVCPPQKAQLWELWSI